MSRKITFNNFEELEEEIAKLIHDGKQYEIHWYNDDPEDYTGWIEVF